MTLKQLKKELRACCREFDDDEVVIDIPGTGRLAIKDVVETFVNVCIETEAL